ncbi:MAG: hypothetical protein RIS35_1416, partial [Pseudomonadota bacterium]
MAGLRNPDETAAWDLIAGANPSGRTELELNGFLRHSPGRDHGVQA